MTSKIDPIKEPYSFLLGLRKTLKNVAVVLVPFFVVAEGLNLGGEYGAAVSLVAYWLKNFIENWK